MIQFNLLPDVKLDFIKAQRAKRSVVAIAIIISALAVFVFSVLLIAVNVAQKGHLNRLNEDIENLTSELEGTPNLTQILTIQNQLSSLPELHDSKPIASRLASYLVQLTPREAKIAEVDVSFEEENSIEISGSATSLEVINKYVDTLKFTDYIKAASEEELEGLIETLNDDTPRERAFSNVELEFSIETDRARGVEYKIKAVFDPEIFNATSFVSLQVPNIISTRSTVERPADLFETAPEDDIEPGGGSQ